MHFADDRFRFAPHVHICLAVSLLGACWSTPAPDPDRIGLAGEESPPPPELSETMWALRNGAQELDATLRPRGLWNDDPDPQRVIATLDDMLATLQPVLDDPARLGHPELLHHLPELETSLETARSALEREPPSYREAKLVTQACLRCHLQRP